MRIAITVASLEKEFGGPVVKTQALAGELAVLGHDVKRLGVGSSREEGTVGLPKLATFHGTPVPAGTRRLRRLVAAADVVHVVGYRDPVGTVAAFTAGRAGVPYVVEPAGMHRRRLRSLRLKAVHDATVGRAVLAGAARIVATTELEKQELVADGIDRGRIVVRPNGVDLGDLHLTPEPGSLRARLGIPRDAPVVLSLGRIAAKKRIDLIVETLGHLPDVWGLVAGPDDGDGTVEQLRRQARRLGIEDRLVIVDEGLWGPDRLAAFEDSDVFCLPSATENFGTAAAEAACMGLPVVVSERCGAAEWLEPAATRVVPYDDKKALSNALGSLLTGSAAKAARESVPRIRRSLDWNRIAREQLSIYEACIS